MKDDRHFAFIPKSTTHSLQLNSLAPTSRWLYVIMAAERHGIDEPFLASYTKLRMVTGFSRTTIRKAILELKEAGFLNYESGGLEQNPNIYTLDKRWLML